MDPKLLALFASAADQLTLLSTTIEPLTDESYTHESHALPGSTIGKHVRHILDHFSLLVKAITISTSSRLVNYSHRERNSATQDSVAGGLASLHAMVDTARSIAAHHPAICASDTITIADTMPSGNDEQFASTIGRELWFCIHHMIHHNAIIASLMHEFGLHPPTQFAYAPSTVKHKITEQNFSK